MARCPSCKSPVARRENPFFPFCTERCKLVDLGRWLREEYRVPVADNAPEAPDSDGEKKPAH